MEPLENRWQFRVLCGVLGCFVLLLVLLPQPNIAKGGAVSRLAMLGAVALCLGMAVPWRFIVRAPLASPGRALGVISKLTGWSCLGFLPAAVVVGSWTGVLVCAVLPIATLGLWLGRTWAIWPWYGLAVGCWVFVAVVVFRWFSDEHAEAPGGAFEWGHSIHLVWMWLGLGLVLWREVRAWHVYSREQRTAPPLSTT